MGRTGGWSRRRIAAGMLSALCLASAPPAAGQPQGRQIDIDPPAQPPGAIVLGTPVGPAAGAPETWSQWSVDGRPTVQNVSVATLTPFLPLRGRANGTAVILAPGGGFAMLAMEHEGWAVARWLNAHGVAVFVLKYRVLPTEPGAAGVDRFWAGFSQPVQQLRVLRDGSKLAIEDAQAAMRLVRERSAAWGVDPDRIGVMGFSAGAITTLGLVYANDPATRPAFVAPIYGPMGAPLGKVPDNPPPMWVSLASDDALFGKTNFALIPAWQAKGGSVEFHLYEKGEHGYGYPGRKGTSTTQWPADFLAWMRARGLLDRKK